MELKLLNKSQAAHLLWSFNADVRNRFITEKRLVREMHRGQIVGTLKRSVPDLDIRFADSREWQRPGDHKEGHGDDKELCWDCRSIAKTLGEVT